MLAPTSAPLLVICVETYACFWQGDVLVALGKIQASALDFLRAATPFAAPGTGGTVPAPAEATAAAATAAATTPVPEASQASGPASDAAPAGRRNLVHKTHRTHTVSILLLVWARTQGKAGRREEWFFLS